MDPIRTIAITSMKNVFQKCKRGVGMAVPKTTETRCRDGSVQARQVIKRLHKQPHPYIFFLLDYCSVSLAMGILETSKPCSKK